MSSTVTSLPSNQSAALSINPVAKTELEKQILKVIDDFKMQLLNQSQNLRITCPITHNVMKDPVTSKCGHVFERSALKNQSSCITCNSKIEDITPDTTTAEMIKELKTNLVVSLESFKSTNSKLALLWLAFTKSTTSRNDYEQALVYSKKAFTHTDSTEEYSKIPTFYDQLQEPNKALISRLYLSLYQLREDRPTAAINTLSSYTTKMPQVKALALALTILSYPSVDRLVQNAKNHALNLKEANPSDSAFIYSQLLVHFPDDLEVQSHLFSLLSAEPEKESN